MDGYRIWAPQYDAPNPLIDVEQPIVHDILSALPPGDAVDAACGTGRHARYLSARGHRVTAVDSSPAMLAHARTAVPEAAFHQGDLHALPLPDNSADVVVCALALAHVPALPPVFAECARILRPGARLVVSDIHPGSQYLGGVAGVTTPDGRRQNMPAHRHLPSAYIRAATDAGLTVLRCEEPPWPPSPAQGGPLARVHCPQAADDAYAAVPAAIIWEFTAAPRTATPGR